MSRDRIERMTADLERGFTALEEGRLEEAAATLERCRRIDRSNEGVIQLAAAVADAQGDTDEAIEQYRALIELHKDDPVPRICLARLELHDLQDPDAALKILEAAFDFIDEESDLIEAIMLRSEALIARGDPSGARESLAELATSVIDDGELALDLGELALAAQDPEGARRWLEIARPMPDFTADALHLLGRVYEETGDRPKQAESWLEVRRIDLAAPAPKITITDDEVESIATEAFDELPEEIRKKLEHVPILIEEVPSEDLVRDGVDPRLLGLFQGNSLNEDGALAANVTNIHLFTRNLARIAVDREHLEEEIRVTVIHETAHYFGLDDDDLEQLGLE